MLVCKQTPKNNVQLVHRPSENATNYLKEFDLIKELTPRCITAVFGSAYRFMPTPCADRPLFKQFLPLTPERYFKKKDYRFKEYLKTQT